MRSPEVTNASPRTVYVTAWRELPVVRNTSSFPLGDQAGNTAPLVDTCHFPPGPGKGLTNTSKRPVSSDIYATHLPSGENTGNCSLADDDSHGAAGPGFGSSDPGSCQV